MVVLHCVVELYIVELYEEVYRIATNTCTIMINK